MYNKRVLQIVFCIILAVIMLPTLQAQDARNQPIGMEAFAQQVRNIVSRENDILANELKANMDSDFEVLDGTMQHLVKSQTRKLLFGILGIQLIMCAGMMYIIITSERRFQTVAEINRKLSGTTQANQAQQKEQDIYKSFYEGNNPQPQQLTEKEINEEAKLRRKKLIYKVVMGIIVVGSILIMAMLVKVLVFTPSGV